MRFGFSVVLVHNFAAKLRRNPILPSFSGENFDLSLKILSFQVSVGQCDNKRVFAFHGFSQKAMGF
jgi:hypothetical protein